MTKKAKQRTPKAKPKTKTKRARFSTSKLTPDQREEIKAIIEQTMLTGRFRLSSARAIAKRFGVSTEMVHRYRRQVEQRWLAEWERRPGLLDTVDWQQRIRAAEAFAYEKGDVKALESLLRTEARVLGIEKMVVEMKHSGQVDGALELGLAGVATEKLEQALDALLLKHADATEKEGQGEQ